MTQTKPIDLSVGHLQVEPAGIWKVSVPGTAYTPPEGLQSLRAALSTWLGVPLQEIAVTTGASLALASSLALLERPGSILCPRPYYPAYPRLAGLLGLRPLFYDLDPTSGWQPDTKRMDDLVRHDTRAILLNFPHNPTGSVLLPEAVPGLQDLVEREGLEVISDEVYLGFVYEDGSLPGMRETFDEAAVISVRSFSKEFGIPGERLGYVIADSDRLRAIVRIHRALAVSPPATAQYIALKRLSEDPDLKVRRLRDVLRLNRDLAVGILEGCDGVELTAPKGGLFVWITLPDCSISSEILARECAARTGVLVSPGAWFGMERPASLRASFALEREDLLGGFGELAGFLGSI